MLRLIEAAYKLHPNAIRYRYAIKGKERFIINKNDITGGASKEGIFVPEVWLMDLDAALRRAISEVSDNAGMLFKDVEAIITYDDVRSAKVILQGKEYELPLITFREKLRATTNKLQQIQEQGYGGNLLLESLLLLA